MTVTHSPEPWRVTPDDPAGAIEDANGVQCAEAWPGNGLEAEQDANARRIVAAVNAVAGISTEALESGALAKLLDRVEGRAVDEGCADGCGCGVLQLLRALGRLP